ncbi:hypothetical protein KP509_37G036900 [Ceratopteris richardii]|uniref:MLO-like protein n=1 Tax=Ceratopteris richardii TaxID=49495 RepID=A0A8T2Q6V4_CERRI|nr:hypothetical protein KP509_37G036900 [Ceratopteris richardii]
MQHILTKMANNIKQKHAVVVGMPIVMPDDQYFGFGRPWLILGCFHFIVFQNAQGTAYAIWAAVTFPSHNCLYKTSATLVSRILIGTLVQGYCALFILPVYALISQMGMRLKKTIFSGQVNVALTKWRSSAKMRIVKTEKDGRTNKSQHTPIFVPMEESCISASAVEVDQS